MAASCEELTHWKRLWCWEGLGAGGEGDDRGWDGWMASLTRWMWVWVNSRSWWWTGRPGVLRFMGLQRVGHDWATDLIWSDLMCFKPIQPLEDNKAILFCSLWVSASSCSCYNLSPNFEIPCFDSVPCFWISLYFVENHLLIYSHTSCFRPSQILWFFTIESLWQPCIKEA